MDFLTIVLIAIALIIFFRYFVKIGRKPDTPATKPLPTTKRTHDTPTTRPPPTTNRAHGVHTWESLGNFDFEVAGESHYQPVLKSIAGSHDKHGPTQEYTASLIPEDNNRYDRNAIRVEIDGQTVGYLSRDDAPRFRRRLGAKKLTGQTTRCNAILSGGFTMESGERASYGVKLDLKPFD